MLGSMGTANMIKKLSEKVFKNDIVRFIFIGGCSTIIDFAVYMLLSLQLPITISKGTSMICASVFSYFANKNFTFEVKEKTNVIYLVKFYLVFAANFCSNILTNCLVYRWLESKFLAFVLATLVGMTVNYTGQKFIVFKK